MMGAFPEQQARDEVVEESGPAFWECLPHSGFT